MSTIALASNPVLHSRAKHIELDIHFVRDKVAAKEIELRHVPSLDQVADILTKPLSLQFFARLRNKLGVCSLASLELRGSVNLCSINTKKMKGHAQAVDCEESRNDKCIITDSFSI